MINPNKINIQEKFAPFFARYIIPIIAGMIWIEPSIGYERAISVGNASSPNISSYAAVTDGIKNEIAKPIANNQTFFANRF